MFRLDNEILELLKAMRNDIKSMNERLIKLEEGQKRIEKKIDSVYDQTADLTEFRTDTTSKLDKLINVTKDNCYEIANLKIVK